MGMKYCHIVYIIKVPLSVVFYLKLKQRIFGTRISKIFGKTEIHENLLVDKTSNCGNGSPISFSNSPGMIFSIQMSPSCVSHYV